MNANIEMLSPAAPVSMSDDWYQYATEDHFWIQWRFSVILRLLRGLEIGDRVIDIGCGHGVARNQLEEHYRRPVHGCDLNLSAMQTARQGKGKLYVYDVHDRRPEWEGDFSCVFLLDTLEHLEDSEAFLKSIGFHLNKGGLLVVNVPAIQCLYSRYDEVAGHVKRYNMPLLDRELNAAGFRIVRSSYWGLTMVPLIALRKAIVRFVSSERVISRGIQPPSRLAESLLRCLMHAEIGLLPRPWIGTSIAAVARKMD